MQRDEARIKQQREEIKKLAAVIKERGMPEEIVCPITQDIMLDPVSAADGHAYERKAIEEWFAKGNKTSPNTNAELENRTLIPSIPLARDTSAT